MWKLLLADDDLDLLSTLERSFKAEGLTVECVSSGDEALYRLNFYSYDLAVLDWEMPLKSGPRVIREYRDNGGEIPIILLTGRSDVEFRIEGLSQGADDYLCKPFAFRELLARVKRVLSRASSITPTVIKMGNLDVDISRAWIECSGKLVSISSKEVSILRTLWAHKGSWVSSSALLSACWSSESETTEDAVWQAMLRLKKKLKQLSAEHLIETARNLGYRLKL